MKRGPEKIETARLLLRKPKASDAQAVFDRYATDREVTRYLSWPTHRSVADTLAFLSWSDSEWQRWPAGPFLVIARDGKLLGSTGLSYKTNSRAMTGYAFARDAWGSGYATESLEAMVELGVKRAFSDSKRSAMWITALGKSMEKCGFRPEEVRRNHFAFPNLGPQKKSEVFSYVLTL